MSINYIQISFFIFLISAVSGLNAQSNMSLVGQLGYNNVELSDVWGYEDSMGNEYALVGVQTGFSIVDVSTNPANPTELFYIPGAFSTWRDIKTWETYAYVTNEEADGLLIVDLTNLPDSIAYYEETFGGQLSTAHNIFIDENGYAYVVGTNVVAGAMFLDLNSDPYNPVWVGSYNENYIHDLFVRNDTMWSAEINAGIFAVVDVSDKSFPTVMATKSTPSNFAHNVWLSDDGNTLFTTDEVPNAFIAAYDVSNLNNITEIDRIQSSPGQNVIPHNTFVLGDFLITSYYRDGVTIMDITQPDNIIAVGNYDTSPNFTGNGFNGCWGVYPFLSSGNIIATDIEEGLYVIAPTYNQACYLHGVVTDSASGGFMQGVDIQIVSTPVQEVTGLSGGYKTGIAAAGTYDVSFSKAGFQSKVINGVMLSNGVTTILDVELAMLPSFAFTIQVLEEGTLNPIQDAVANVRNAQFVYDETANASGAIGIATFFDGTYDIIVGKWGYKTQLLTNQVIAATNNSLTVLLSKGYYDDFALDFNWTNGGNATTGFWERGEPDGTSSQGNQANPELDVADDISDLCYVTGNAGGGAGNDDIDDGDVILTSPTFDISAYNNPYINYHRWFYNGGGFGGQANDTMTISISDGISEVVVETITLDNTQMSTWVYNEFRILDHVAPGSNMQFVVRAVDSDPGHLLEAAFDKFQIVDSASVTSIAPINDAKDFGFEFYPNPASQEINISLFSADDDQYELILTDVLGNRVDVITRSKGMKTTKYNLSKLSKGLYFLQMNLQDKKAVKKLVVTN